MLNQGYLIQKPELAPLPPKINHLLDDDLFTQTNQSSLACDLVVNKSCVEFSTNVEEVFSLFETNVYLNSIAVVDNLQIKGMIYRQPFYQNMPKSNAVK